MPDNRDFFKLLFAYLGEKGVEMHELVKAVREKTGNHAPWCGQQFLPEMPDVVATADFLEITSIEANALLKASGHQPLKRIPRGVQLADHRQQIASLLKWKEDHEREHLGLPPKGTDQPTPYNTGVTAHESGIRGGRGRGTTRIWD